jgi:hypothetical protein
VHEGEAGVAAGVCTHVLDPGPVQAVPGFVEGWSGQSGVHDGHGWRWSNWWFPVAGGDAGDLDAGKVGECPGEAHGGDGGAAGDGVPALLDQEGGVDGVQHLTPAGGRASRMGERL